MLQIRLNEETNNLEIRFKYNWSYIDRLKTLGCCQFKDEDKMWVTSLKNLPALQSTFEGEIMYITPEWQLTGGTPPDYSVIYRDVSKVVPMLKAPYKPYNFQSFGANFLATMAMKHGFGCLFDDMGTGRCCLF